MTGNQTIAAIATARGEGGVAIVRVSGNNALNVLKGIFQKKADGAFAPGRLYYGRVLDEQGKALDEAMAVYMKAPHTYTREDVCEIHCHGGRVMPALVLRRAIEMGARPAQPGEFTKRAFLNGRIDLSRAEAVMAVVSAGSEAFARQAARQLEGGASRAVMEYARRLTDMLSAIEAAIDFPEEIDGEITRGELLRDINDIISGLTRDADPRRAKTLREGLSACLAGPPNTGKSSLLNALCGGERAIVTDIEGTTRDVLTEEMNLSGARVLLLDTAGRRDTADQIEQIGVRRAREAEISADVVLVVLDYAKASPGENELLDDSDARRYLIYNKCDLPPRDHFPAFDPARTLRVSARTGQGVQEIAALLEEKAREGEDQPLTLQRHLYLANTALKALHSARAALEGGTLIDLCAIDIRQALSDLYEITGQNASERVIDSIFQNFCVGK